MNLRHVSILTRIDVLRQYRTVREDTGKLAVMTISGFFLLLFDAFVTFGMYVGGQNVTDGTLPISLAIVRGGLALVVALTVVMTAIRVVQTSAVPENADGVLTIASHRDVVVSVVLGEILTLVALFGGPAVIWAVAFGLGADSLTAGLTALLGAWSMLLTGAILGVVGGFAVRNAIARSEFLARYKTGIAAFLFLAYLLVVMRAGAEENEATMFDSAVGALNATPLGWFADLALAGSPVAVSLPLAAGAVLLTLGAAVGGFLATDALAALLWYRQPVEGTREGGESASMRSFGGVPRPISRVAYKNWLRAWRAPMRLIYVAYPLIFGIGIAADALESGEVPPGVPAMFALYGAWATGAAFTLNPIGDEASVLPVTLTSPISGRQFIAGCALAGVAIGTPITAVVTTGSSILVGYSPVEIGAFAVLGVFLPVGAAGLASGIGALLPRMEPAKITRNRKEVIPSLFGFVVYSLVLSLVASPALVGATPEVRSLAVNRFGASSTGFLIGGFVVTLVVLGTIAWISYRYAVAKFEEYYLA